MFEAIHTLSSSHVKSGQSIKVFAGVGAFSEASNPRITINDSLANMENGVARYEFIAKGKPGKHFVNIRFEFTLPDGIKALKEERPEYVISQ